MKEVKEVREEMRRKIKRNEEKMEKIQKEVEILEKEMKMKLLNKEFVKIWGMDVEWMEKRKRKKIILESMREEGKIKEKKEWRKWKDQII